MKGILNIACLLELVNFGELSASSSLSEGAEVLICGLKVKKEANSAICHKISAFFPVGGRKSAHKGTQMRVPIFQSAVSGCQVLWPTAPRLTGAHLVASGDANVASRADVRARFPMPCAQVSSGYEYKPHQKPPDEVGIPS